MSRFIETWLVEISVLSMLLLTMVVYSDVKWCWGCVDNPSGQISYWGHRNVGKFRGFHGVWSVGYVQKNLLSAFMPITIWSIQGGILPLMVDDVNTRQYPLMTGRCHVWVTENSPRSLIPCVRLSFGSIPEPSQRKWCRWCAPHDIFVDRIRQLPIVM